ncbi:MAG TPA: GTP-binding protein [Gemmatimonadaceae bacterium]|nr:GTP-binding protein [Gemmatimonadaceae bacterium]
MRVIEYGHERKRSIPLTVIDGRPGAGKSAVVRHAMLTASGQRVVAITRDLGALLPGASDVRRDGPVAMWPNGSMAIATDDPTATLAMLARREAPPDHVIVEAADSNPRKLGGYGYMPGYRPDGLVTVVDASAAASIDGDRAASETWTTSLRLADLVVLNKTDLAGKETTTGAQRMIASFAPQARFVWAAEGKVALPLLLDVAGSTALDDRAVVAEWHAAYVPTRSRGGLSLVGEHCRCWYLLGEQPVDSKEFRRWVNRMPSFVLRAAGEVYLEQVPDYRHEFSLIGMRWLLKRGAPWGRDLPATRVTLVGIDGTRGAAAESPRRTLVRRQAAVPGATL